MGRSNDLDGEESAMALPRSGIFLEDLGLQTSHKSNDIDEKLFFPSSLALFERFLISDPKRHTAAATAKGCGRKDLWGEILFLLLR